MIEDSPFHSVPKLRRKHHLFYPLELLRLPDALGHLGNLLQVPLGADHGLGVDRNDHVPIMIAFVQEIPGHESPTKDQDHEGQAGALDSPIRRANGTFQYSCRVCGRPPSFVIPDVIPESFGYLVPCVLASTIPQ
jgi:hypothetical protein